MTTLFLAPVDESSYRSTLEHEIDLADWEDRPSNFPEQTRVWGVRTDLSENNWSRNRNSWKEMNSGDPILFYQKGRFFADLTRAKYFAKGRVGFKCETNYIRDEYWNGAPASAVFSVENYEEGIGLERKEVNEILDYKEKFHPQGLWKVDDNRPINRLLWIVGFSDSP